MQSSNYSPQLDRAASETPEHSQKETKLIKFIKSLSEQVIEQIETYLTNIQNPKYPNNKPGKIHLHHDLQIIHRFKSNEKNITNKQKVKEICFQLQKQLSLAHATIKQRISKKLSNISPNDLLQHIRMKKDIAFDAKRRLVSGDMKMKGENLTVASNSKYSTSGKKTEQLGCFSEKKTHQTNRKQEERLTQQSRKQFTNKISMKYQDQQMEQQYAQHQNDFMNISDHSQDQQFFCVFEGSQARVSSFKVQKLQQQIKNKVEATYSLLKSLNFQQQLLLNSQKQPTVVKQLPEPQQIQESHKKKSSKKSRESKTPSTKKSKKDNSSDVYTLPSTVEKDQKTLDSYFKKQFTKKFEILSNTPKQIIDLSTQKQKLVIDISQDSSGGRQSQSNSVSNANQNQNKTPMEEQNNEGNNIEQLDKSLSQDIWYSDQDQFLRDAIVKNQTKYLEILKKYKSANEIKKRACKLSLILPECQLELLNKNPEI